ncbi:clathrin light chain [Talaromyces stipitatus ATCC 10500]|uniref:Clathrin light chain n=1 Tax=Talaromyces stipitatus (strain ATCC 10500 / CBS 375.48 / QM 6759 / NRRL 1006) TaxID=441959 RepID=B8MKU5_TALSN|nr:clathrin light chain [Talaromyces stipitatus ATCC 10500]EED14944.1 clathrin light chain [Talaromyces stipitatus ATCC 10500]
MADRFPSLEDFNEGQTEVVSNDVADTDDFLARERAALGDDAAQFATPNDQVATVDDDLLGGDEVVQQQGDSAEISGFESSFPAIDTQNEAVAPGGTITGTGSPFPSTGYSNYAQPEEEPEAVREWRARRDADLARRAETSAEKKAATIKKAQEDIDDFYVSYGNRADKARAQTRKEAEEFLANREDTSAGGTSWERIAKLVDISGKGVKGGASGSGKERFRELLLDLRKDANAPGASGV